MDDVAIGTISLAGVSAAAVRATFHGLVYADDVAFASCRRWSVLAMAAALLWLALPGGGGVEPQWAAVAAIAALDCSLVAWGSSPSRLPRATARGQR